jgi:hypothetical protein
MIKEVNNWVITINEYRSAFNLELSKEENSDKLIISKNLSLLDDIWVDFTVDKNE